MDSSFTPLTKSLPPEGKKVEFWSGGAIAIGHRRDGRNWIDGASVLVDGWRFIVKNKPARVAAAPVEAPAPARKRGRPAKAAA